ncbi:MAG: excinuclease ABC subunit UvrA, partial [Bacteroidota bacterium]|nr:excinuclease ABC subunit UvrA [Bacteroidota bacterium]
KTIQDVGLGYISLGQQSTTLSGGEAQRIKLATELSKRDTGNTFYILDEPTTGLHFEDVRILMDVLNRLTDKGNTMLIIEHNLDVIKMADHIIDIGYEGGRNGGQLVAKGTPEEVAKDKKSFTAKFLRNELN